MYTNNSIKLVFTQLNSYSRATVEFCQTFEKYCFSVNIKKLLFSDI